MTESSRLSQELVTAIGRVAVESAALEASLRFLLDDLAPVHDYAWFLYEGQPTDWLINACLAVLRTRRMYDKRTEWPDDVEETLRRAKTLSERRNQIVHGQWMFEDPDDPWAKVVPRPWGGKHTDDSMLCVRSRRFSEWVPERWTARVVDRLAEELAQTNDAVAAARLAHQDSTLGRPRDDAETKNDGVF